MTIPNLGCHRFLGLLPFLMLSCGTLPSESGTASTARALVAFEVPPLPSLEEAPKYAVVELGTFGGHPAHATAMNDAYDVVGNCEAAPFNDFGNGVDRAFLWRNGTMNDLGSLGGPGTRSYAVAVNASGVAVGSSEAGGPTVYHATVYGPGGIRDLGTLGGTRSQAYAINNFGVITGNSDDPKFIQQVVWAYGSTGILPSGGPGIACDATGINSSGMMAGGCGRSATDYRSKAIFRTPDSTAPTDIGFLPGGGTSYAEGLNDAGTIVGKASVGDADHAFVYDAPLGMRDLGTLGGMNSQADAINAHGIIVGRSQILPGDRNAGTAATLWRAGKPVDLNTLIPPGTGWSLVEALAINESGGILALGFQGSSTEARYVVLVATALYSVSLVPLDAPLGAAGFTGTVRITKPSPVDLVIALHQVRVDFHTPSLPLDVPATVTLPARSTEVSFHVPSKCIPGNTPVGLDASLGGATVSTTITVHTSDGCALRAKPRGIQ